MCVLTPFQARPVTRGRAVRQHDAALRPTFQTLATRMEAVDLSQYSPFKVPLFAHTSIRRSVAAAPHTRPYHALAPKPSSG